MPWYSPIRFDNMIFLKVFIYINKGRQVRRAYDTTVTLPPYTCVYITGMWAR
jgi:hypothetical protein